MQIKKLAVAAAAVGALGVSLLTATPASADYAPGPSDVVGVGSDTVQFAIDFLADGDYTGSAGYNLGQKNRVVNFDATPDANARLAYGSFGVNGTSASTSNCSPGTGGTAGTGNQNTTHTGDRPCTLNPTIVLRAGLKPVQRPNGSGAGFNALKADVTAGTHNIDFARRSSAAADTSGTYNSVNVGQDGLYMLTSSTTNAVPLSAAQLASIYQCSVTTWNNVGLGGSSSATIIPILPQVGSGTRSSFLGLISTTEAQVGSCVINAEENDPEAIDATTSPANAIEPMSTGRLAMYQGKDSSGLALGFGGYFKDPSCAYAVTTPASCTNAGSITLTGYTGASGATTVSKGALTAGDASKLQVGDVVSGTGIAPGATVVSAVNTGTTPAITTTITLSLANTGAVSGTLTFTSSKNNILQPNVTLVTTGAPLTGTLFGSVRNLFVYYRAADLNGTTAFQAGTTRNWVRTLFYNPCSGTDLAGNPISVAAGNCTGGGLYGPGLAPFLINGAALVESSGVNTTSGTGTNAFGANITGGA